MVTPILTMVLLASGTGIAWSDNPREAPAGGPRGVQRQPAGLGPDFPNPESFYPTQARRAGQEGIAVVHVCVDPSGKLTEPPTIAASSGDAGLDAAALNLATAGSGHYRSAVENGVAVRGCTSFRIAFKLTAPPAPPAGPAPSASPRLGPDFPNFEKYYPLEARAAGQEGAAVVRFCIDPAGTLTEPPTIATSSGNQLLDAAAVNLATAGSGHYLPASENGRALPGCGQFRVAFKLAGPTEFPLSDPRFPTISARVVKLDAEFNRRMEAAMSKFGPNARPVLVPTYPDSASTIRQYARAAESAVDDCAAITADFLDDVDYLAKSPDIPAKERSAFAAAWPAERAAFAAKMRELLGATRDLVRLMDELADYVAFKNSQLSPSGGANAGAPASAPDPQITSIQERARRALERLRAVVEDLGASPEQ